MRAINVWWGPAMLNVIIEAEEAACVWRAAVF